MNFGPATYGFGFCAGALSTLSPCVLPLVPVLIGSAVNAHRRGPLALGARTRPVLHPGGHLSGHARREVRTRSGYAAHRRRRRARPLRGHLADTEPPGPVRPRGRRIEQFRQPDAVARDARRACGSVPGRGAARRGVEPVCRSDARGRLHSCQPGEGPGGDQRLDADSSDSVPRCRWSCSARYRAPP